MFTRDFTAKPGKNGASGYDGLDGAVMKMLQEKMNLTPYYILPRDGDTFGKFKNGVTTGSLADVVKKRCHLAGNSRYVTNYTTTDLEFTDFLYSEKLCVVIPKRPEIPRKYMILRVFKPSTWLLIVFAFVLYVTIIYLNNFSSTSGTPISTNILFSLGLFIGIPVKLIHSKHLRILIFCCLFFSVVILGVLQGDLVKHFSTINYDKDINTLEELVYSPHRIFSSSLDEFNIENTDIVAKLVTNDVLGSEYSPLKWFWSLQYMCVHKNISLIGRQSEIDYMKYNVFLSPDGTRCLHTVRESILSYSLAYIVPNESPFLYKINKVIGRLRESGFVLFWNKKELKQKTQVTAEISFKHFSLADLEIPFFVLFLGYKLSLLVFILEMISRRKG